LVAAHENDLQSAQKHGLRTGFVHRPLEHGPGKAASIPAPGKYDCVAKDFLDLASEMGV
jgi:2-haloacid dehalogenase